MIVLFIFIKINKTCWTLEESKNSVYVCSSVVIYRNGGQAFGRFRICGNTQIINQKLKFCDSFKPNAIKLYYPNFGLLILVKLCAFLTNLTVISKFNRFIDYALDTNLSFTKLKFENFENIGQNSTSSDHSEYQSKARPYLWINMNIF